MLRHNPFEGDGAKKSKEVYVMEIQIKKAQKDAIIPKYARKGDAGVDMHSTTRGVILPGESVLIKTGISAEIPEGYEVQIRPRSGLALKHGITVLNSPGTIDAGYRGEIGVVLINHGLKAFVYDKGDRIAQGVVNKVEEASFIEVDELTDSERGEGGFGHSGIN